MLILQIKSFGGSFFMLCKWLSQLKIKIGSHALAQDTKRKCQLGEN